MRNRHSGLRQGPAICQDLNGKEGLLTPLINPITEAALGAELDEHVGQDSYLIVKTEPSTPLRTG